MESNHSNSQQIAAEMNELYSVVTATNARNPGLFRSFTWSTTASDRLPVFTRPTTQRPLRPPNNNNTCHKNLGKTILSLTFQAVLALFISTPTSSHHPLLIPLFGASVFISFAVSFAAIFLQSAYPRIARLFEKIGALLAAIGVCITATLLLHFSFAWMFWLASAFSLMTFILSLRLEGWRSNLWSWWRRTCQLLLSQARFLVDLMLSNS